MILYAPVQQESSQIHKTPQDPLRRFSSPHKEKPANQWLTGLVVAGVRLLFYPRFCFSTKRKANRTQGKAVCFWAYYPTPHARKPGRFYAGDACGLPGRGAAAMPPGGIPAAALLPDTKRCGIIRAAKGPVWWFRWVSCYRRSAVGAAGRFLVCVKAFNLLAAGKCCKLLACHAGLLSGPFATILL